MAISYADAPGLLMTRLGRLGKLVYQMDQYMTAQVQNFTGTNQATDQFAADPDIQGLIGSGYIGAVNSCNAAGSLAAQTAALEINRAVFDDNPFPNQTLQTVNIPASLVEIIRQMKVEGATVLTMNVTTTPTSFTGAGNGQVVASPIRPGDGRVLENSFAENLKLICVNDSYSGGAQPGNEIFSLSGAGNQTNPFAFNWPLGSNCSNSLQAINAASDNSEGNVLTNGSFSTWMSDFNTPTSWTIPVGFPGVQVFQEDTLVYVSNQGAVRFQGDGVTQVQMQQLFNTTTALGTTGVLLPSTAYGCALWMRRDGLIPSQGVLSVELVDNIGNVIQDNAGVNNAFTIDLTQLTVAYAPFSGSFRTPQGMPSSYSIRLRQTTPLTNGRSIYLDQLSIGASNQAYSSGPFVSIHAGSTPFQLADFAQVAVTNSRGVGGSLSSWQVFFERCFLSDMLNNGFLLPSSNTPTISDLLLTRN